MKPEKIDFNLAFETGLNMRSPVTNESVHSLVDPVRSR